MAAGVKMSLCTAKNIEEIQYCRSTVEGYTFTVRHPLKQPVFPDFDRLERGYSKLYVA